MPLIKDVIRTAEAEIGYFEKATNEYLYEKTANIGNGNWTKYSEELAKAGFFNGNKNGYDWCAVFVNWVFYKNTGGVIPTMVALCQDGASGAGCTQSRGYYKNHGRLFDTPMVGDQAFFSSSQRNDPDNADHTALVVGVSGARVTVIEGNWNNRVARNTYTLGDGWLYDFGRPYYDDEVEVDDTPQKNEEEVYKVQSGDTLWDIAVTHGCTVDELVEWNNIDDRNVISVGQIIRFKKTDKVVPKQETKGAYTVVAGDTLWDIAQRFGTTVDFLVERNNIADRSLIHVGQRIFTE